jgi:hypothetical protein
MGVSGTTFERVQVKPYDFSGSKERLGNDLVVRHGLHRLQSFNLTNF